jgi:hypothetical protein
VRQRRNGHGAGVRKCKLSRGVCVMGEPFDLGFLRSSCCVLPLNESDFIATVKSRHYTRRKKILELLDPECPYRP